MKWTCLIPVVLAIGLAGCRKTREIVVYTVDKEPAKTTQNDANPHAGAAPLIPLPDTGGGAAAAGADPHVGMPVLAGPAISDQAPPHWQKGKASAMRMASYQVKDGDGAMIDISFTSLRSAADGLLNNLNRWRDQVGLEPWDEQGMKQSTTIAPTHFGDAVLIDVEAASGKVDKKVDGRIIGAIAEQDGRAWFFKMRGNPALAGQEKAAFIRWMATLKPSEPVAPMPAVENSKALDWSLPDGWSATFGGQSRYATIEVPGAQTTNLVVSFFPGDVGGDVANVNRWRGQVGLSAAADAEALASIRPLDGGNTPFKLVDLKGTTNRMLAAWTSHGGNTWFFKWTGGEVDLEQGMATYLEFLKSVRFNSTEP